MSGRGHSLAGLPVWARQEIERLRANERYYKDQLQLAIGEKLGPIEIDPNTAEERRKFLGGNSRVEFTLGNRGKVQAYLDGGELVVYGAGSLRLLVLPCAGNVVKVRVE